jgi:cyclopropane fatty-acyl-phospholipid synthase-like methyltransferase
MHEKDILGLSRHIGDRHYRAYIGPPDEYDLVSAMSFNLLTTSGLRQSHKLLDIGCGSLRLGRLLIPYLNPDHYVGIDPNKWLIDDGLRYEIGASLIELRRPKFIYDTGLDSLASDIKFNYVIAQSIFSHTAPDLLERWIKDVSLCLADDGVFFATVLEGSVECDGEGWIYPECVEYRLDTVSEVAKKYGLKFEVLNWHHPRQTWCALYRPGFNQQLLNSGTPSWNNFGKLREEAAL